MTLRELQYLVAVAELGHFGQAAKHCFVSQPTLSTQLKKLEDELNVSFFERNNKQVLVTPAGKILVEQARNILNGVKHFKQLAQHITDPLAGNFHLGIIPTLGPYLLPHILMPIKEAFPKLALHICEDKTDNVLQSLREGKLDAVILALPVVEKGFVVKECFREPFYVALPVSSHLAKNKVVTLKELENEQLLLLDEGHCLREQALEACELSGAQGNYEYKATSLETLRQIVATGAGVTLLPALAVEQAGYDQSIVIRPFADPIPSRSIGILWRESSVNQECCELILQKIKQQMRRVDALLGVNQNMKVMKRLLSDSD